MSIDNSQIITQSLRKQDLADFFPTAAKFYPGYVKMAVFREKLKLLITAISVTDNSRELLYLGVDSTDWRPEDLSRKLQSELRKKSAEYAGAAVLSPATQYAGGKVVKFTSMHASTRLNKLATSPKVSAKVGEKINAINKDYKYREIIFGKVTVGSKEIELSTHVAEGNLVETVVDKSFGKVSDLIQGGVERKTGFALPQGVDVSLNNEVTRSWITKFGVSENVANGLMMTVDFLSDFIPVASATKSVESFLANSYMSFRYWNDARAMNETIKFFDKKWNEITANLKVYIKKDLKALSDSEYSALCNMLFEVDFQ